MTASTDGDEDALRFPRAPAVATADKREVAGQVVEELFHGGAPHMLGILRQSEHDSSTSMASGDSTDFLPGLRRDGHEPLRAVPRAKGRREGLSHDHLGALEVLEGFLTLGQRNDPQQHHSSDSRWSECCGDLDHPLSAPGIRHGDQNEGAAAAHAG